MTSPTKNHRSFLLKMIALIIGYSFWYITGSSHITATTLSVPLCFYNTPEHTHLQAPESVSVTISGKRSDIRALDQDQLAVHIDAAQLHPGKNVVQLTHRELMLPRHMKLLQYAPSNLVVELSAPVIPENHS